MNIRSVELPALAASGESGVRTAAFDTKRDAFLEVLQAYERRWSALEQRSSQQLHLLSPEHAQLFAVQRDVSAAALETELISRAADALSGSLRRLQQLHSTP